MLSTRSLDTMAIDDIAAEAGISRGLLFHYFPTKRDFHVAVARAAAQELLDRTVPDPGLPPMAQLRAAVEAFVDHLTDNRDAYVAFIRGSSGGEPQLIEVCESTRTAFTDRVPEGLGVPEPVPAAAAGCGAGLGRLHRGGDGRLAVAG
jgi:AcrR family transcriptional regulator